MRFVRVDTLKNKHVRFINNVVIVQKPENKDYKKIKIIQ
jgi:hypothetical protein